MLSINRNCGPPKNMIWYQPSCEPAPVWPAPRIPSKYDSTSQDCGRSNVHTLCSNTCLLRKILSSIIVQPKNLKSDESITKRLLKRVSKSIQRIGHKILKSKPCNSQRPNERSMQKQPKTKGDSNITSIRTGATGSNTSVAAIRGTNAIQWSGIQCPHGGKLHTWRRVNCECVLFWSICR